MDNSKNPNESLSATHTSGLAIASVVLSCLSVLVGPFGFLPGIICGHLARSECRRNPALTGAGFALAGLIVGYIFVGVTAVMLTIGILIMIGGVSSEPFVYTLF